MLAFSLLLGTALAGCMEGGPGGDGSDLTSEEARTEVETALETLEGNTTVYGSKVSVNVTFTNETDEGTETGYMDMYLDADLGEVVLRMAGEGFSGSGSSGGSSLGYLVVGRMGQTAIFGGDGSIISGYNDSAASPSAFDSLDELNPGTPGGSDSNPTFLFEALQKNLTQNVDEFTAEDITYQGEEALEIKSTGDEESGASLRVVIWKEPKRPALIEGRVTEEAAQNNPNLEEPGEITMRFQYGDDATLEMRDDLTRVETLTFMSSEDASTTPGQEGWLNHTIQPSRDIPEGEVSLDEVTARVMNQTFGGQGEEVLAVSLDQGSAESDEARFTYEDADGDGMVSEGDEIRVERLDENASLSLELEDTVTGLKVTPSLAALGALAAAGAAAALLRGRRR